MVGRTLDNQIRAQNTHSGNTDTCLGSSVGGTETCEDDGGRAAHRTEEGLSAVSIDSRFGEQHPVRVQA
jgi:hypothetical protein